MKELLTVKQKEELQQKLKAQGYIVTYHPTHLRIWSRIENTGEELKQGVKK